MKKPDLALVRYAYFSGAHCAMLAIANTFAAAALNPDIDVQRLADELAVSLKRARDKFEFSKGFSDRDSFSRILTEALLERD